MENFVIDQKCSLLCPCQSVRLLAVLGTLEYQMEKMKLLEFGMREKPTVKFFVGREKGSVLRWLPWRV